MLPVALEGTRPFMQWPYRIGVSPVQLLAALAAHPNQPHIAQHPQVLGDGRLLQAERCHNLSDRPLGSSKIAQNLPPAGLSNRVESVRCGACSCHDETLHSYIGIRQAQIRNQGCSPGFFPTRMITYNTEIMNQRNENSTCVKSGAHNAPNRCSGAKVVLKARTVMPALRPARIPAGVSSTTTQWSYRTPRRPAAIKYPSGSGFPRTTSSPLIRSGGTGRPAHSSLTVANALLAEVTTAH